MATTRSTAQVSDVVPRPRLSLAEQLARAFAEDDMAQDDRRVVDRERWDEDEGSSGG